MKRVFQCDFCSKSNVNSEPIIEHEKSCSFNPSIKQCWTCLHHVDEGMPISGSMYVCQKGLDTWEVKDEGKPCEFWENENNE